MIPILMPSAVILAAYCTALIYFFRIRKKYDTAKMKLKKSAITFLVLVVAMLLLLIIVMSWIENSGSSSSNDMCTECGVRKAQSGGVCNKCLEGIIREDHYDYYRS